MDLIPFLSQPIVQAGGLLGFLMTLHKSGIVDVKALVRAAVGIDSGVKQVNGDTRNSMQTLLSKMEELTQYANHDTTKSLGEIAAVLERLGEKMDGHVREHDKMVYLMEDLKENGVKCRP